MAASEDTEITLGTGKMLALFFGLVALCAVFFGMGFSLGKNSAKPWRLRQAATAASRRASHGGQGRLNLDPPSDLTFYKAVGQKDPNAQLTPNAADAPATPAPPSRCRRQRRAARSHGRLPTRTATSCRWRR